MSDKVEPPSGKSDRSREEPADPPRPGALRKRIREMLLAHGDPVDRAAVVITRAIAGKQGNGNRDG